MSFSSSIQNIINYPHHNSEEKMKTTDNVVGKENSRNNESVAKILDKIKWLPTKR